MKDAKGLTIQELLARYGQVLELHVLAGASGLQRVIDHSRINKPSLAFAGFLDDIDDCQLQVIGRTELKYLATRPAEEQQGVVNALFERPLAGVVVTCGMTPPDIIVQAAERSGTPLLGTRLSTQHFVSQMVMYLALALAPVTHQHGVYMDIFGLGVLLIGPSGIGKSEIGLELISRGHRLVADDMVAFVRQGPDIIVGHSPDALRYHMEIRGLGVLNIRDMFGAAAITDTKRLRLVIELVPGDQAPELLPREESSFDIQGVSVPRIFLPIRPGRSLAVLVEVATRNHLMKLRGIDSNKNFMDALQRRLHSHGSHDPS